MSSSCIKLLEWVQIAIRLEGNVRLELVLSQERLNIFSIFSANIIIHYVQLLDLYYPAKEFFKLIK